MTKDLTKIFQTADWKKEKHVPVIDVAAKVKKGEEVRVIIKVGKEIPHPNTTEHHISWIDVYFHPDAENFPYHLGRFELLCHGASISGPNTSTVHAQPDVCFIFTTQKAGTIMAFSFCNIHGLWFNSRELKVE